MMLSAIGRCAAWAFQAISLAQEGVLAMQTTAQRRWRLGGHQRDAPRQGDHLKGLARTEAELLADCLGITTWNLAATVVRSMAKSSYVIPLYVISSYVIPSYAIPIDSDLFYGQGCWLGAPKRMACLRRDCSKVVIEAHHRQGSGAGGTGPDELIGQIATSPEMLQGIDHRVDVIDDHSAGAHHQGGRRHQKRSPPRRPARRWMSAD
jgi:hypothetical protein